MLLGQPFVIVTELHPRSFDKAANDADVSFSRLCDPL